MKTLKLNGLGKFMFFAGLTLVFVLTQELILMGLSAYGMGHYYFEIGLDE